jgi:methionine-S-sulfoxide reductase
MSQQAATEVAILGGGCFWCTEAVYLERAASPASNRLHGRPGARPDLRAGVRGHTGHAEVVRLEFDPDVISYRDILEIFFTIHDPTTLNRQGNDVGTQYRSVIFFQSPEQEATARQVMAEMAACGTRRSSPSCCRRSLVQGRGLSPELLRAASAAGLLRLRGGAQGGEVPQDLCTG